MCKKRDIIYVFLIFIVSIFTFSSVYSQETQIITLDEFIKIAINNNPAIFSELTKIKLAQAQQIQSRAIYNVLFDINYAYQNIMPENESESNRGIVKQSANNFGLSAGGIIPYTGTRYNFGFDFAQADTWSYQPNFEPEISLIGSNISMESGGNILTNVLTYNPRFSFKIQQPLLKNWFGILDTFPIRQTELNRDITSLTVDETIETIILDLYQVYFDWYLTYHKFDIFSESVENSEKLLVQVKEKVFYDLSDQSELDQVFIMNVEYKKSRDLLGMSMKMLTKKIYRWMYGDRVMPPDVRFIPQDELIISDIPEIDDPINNSRQMRILDLSKKMLIYQLEKEKNEALPELNLFFQYSVDNTSYYQDEFFKLEDFNDNYQAGIQFSYPIGDSLSAGKIEETYEKLKKWEKDVANFERSYLQGLVDLQDLISVYKTVKEYDLKLIEHATSQVEWEEVKYRQGRSDLYFIIQNEDKLIDYRITYLIDYVELMNIKIQLLALLDKLYN